MSFDSTAGLSRRSLLKGGGALVVGVALSGCGPLARFASKHEDGEAQTIFAPNAFVRVSSDNTVTLVSKHIEFGQGPWSGLATLVADEMDADWSQMRAVSAPVDAAYNNLFMGGQGTGGSTSIANSYEQMRKAGAAARMMLVQSAAQSWKVDANEIEVERGVLSHTASGRKGRFGDFAALAATLPVPSEPQLKSPERFRLIGKENHRIDSESKSTGRAEFTIDQYRDQMLTAVVAHPPLFGATVGKFDDRAARAIDGVSLVEAIPQGVAVYARDTYSAIQGRRALAVTWDESRAETRSSEEIGRTYLERSRVPGAIASTSGDVARALAALDVTRIEREIVFPYLAHAPMEPLDAVLEPTAAGVKATMGSQGPGRDHPAIAEVLGLTPEQVEIDTPLTGGSFGRRSTPDSEFAREAAEVYKALASQPNGPRPVKLLWTREDDIQGGFYRPLTVHRLSGSVTKSGEISGWDQTIVGQSFLTGTPASHRIKDGIDQSMGEGASNLAYSIPNRRLSMHIMPGGVPVLWWRSVGHTHTGFAVETFIDELLEVAGRDPVEGRLPLLAEHPRNQAVLRRAAEMADWGRSLGPDRALGVAVHESFRTIVAQVVEVGIAENPRRPRVHRVWCAVDCGVAVNPDIIRAQMEGGIGYGLGAALYSEITLDKGGRVRQSNFDRYQGLRIHEMPEVKVAIIDSNAPPTGVGEPGVPPIAPAVANAWRKLTGQRTERLPWVPVS